jgi:hypothetical protein
MHKNLVVTRTGQTATGKLGNLIGHSMDSSNTVRPLSASDKHLQQMNLARIRLAKSFVEPELSNELAKFEASLIESKEDFYDIQTN